MTELNHEETLEVLCLRMPQFETDFRSAAETTLMGLHISSFVEEASDSDLVFYAFDWGSSVQGSKFWGDVHHHFTKMEVMAGVQEVT
jgi:hypothetical protein